MRTFFFSGHNIIMGEASNYTIGYEIDGDEKSWSTSAESKADARRKFIDYMTGNGKRSSDYRIIGIFDKSEDDINESRGVSNSDIVISDNSDGGYDVGSTKYGYFGNFDTIDDALDYIVKWTERKRIYPQLWMRTGDGNMMTIDYEGNEVDLGENNTTANLDGGIGQVKTPFIFQRIKPSKYDKKKMKKNYTSSTGYKLAEFNGDLYERTWTDIGKINKSINELNYRDFRNDRSISNEKKINLKIDEIYASIIAIERLLTHVNKLKTEFNISNKSLRSRTLTRLRKLGEKMNRLNYLIRELNK